MVDFGAGNKKWYTPDIPAYDYNLRSRKGCSRASASRTATATACIEDPRGNPITFPLKTNSDNTMRVAPGNFVRRSAKVGIQVVLSPIDFDTLITNIRRDLQDEAVVLGPQSSTRPIPRTRRTSRSSGITHFFYVGQKNPETPRKPVSIGSSTSW